MARRTVRAAPARAVRRVVRPGLGRAARSGPSPPAVGCVVVLLAQRPRHRGDPRRRHRTPASARPTSPAPSRSALVGDAVVVVDRTAGSPTSTAAAWCARTEDTCLPGRAGPAAAGRARRDLRTRRLLRPGTGLLRLGRPAGRGRRRTTRWRASVTSGDVPQRPARLRASRLSLAPAPARRGRAAGHRRSGSRSPPPTGVRRTTSRTRRLVRGRRPASTDVLLRTPPGRWAFVRVRLTGDGRRTPVLHRIRLDLPRRTGLDRPAGGLLRGPACPGLHRALRRALRRLARTRSTTRIDAARRPARRRRAARRRPRLAGRPDRPRLRGRDAGRSGGARCSPPLPTCTGGAAPRADCSTRCGSRSGSPPSSRSSAPSGPGARSAPPGSAGSGSSAGPRRGCGSAPRGSAARAWSPAATRTSTRSAPARTAIRVHVAAARRRRPPRRHRRWSRRVVRSQTPAHVATSRRPPPGPGFVAGRVAARHRHGA